MPQITEVMCKLPFGAHGSAAGKALQLLKQCAAQVRHPCSKLVRHHTLTAVSLTAVCHARTCIGRCRCRSLQLCMCMCQVTPERPDDLRIIVDDLRAFMSSNIPASVSELFPRTIETLLNDYVKALGPQHAVVPFATARAPAQFARLLISALARTLCRNLGRCRQS